MSEARPADVAPGNSSLPDIRDWRAQSHSFQDIAWYTTGIRSVDIPGFSDFIPVIVSSANLLVDLAGRAGAGPQLLAGRRSARPRRCGADQLDRVGEILQQESPGGRQLAQAGQQDLHRHRRHAAGFEFPYVGDGRRCGFRWCPTKENEERDSRTLTAVGRLKPGVSVAAAQAELERNPDQHRESLSHTRTRQARHREELSRGADRQCASGAAGAAVCRAGGLADRLRQCGQPVAVAHHADAAAKSRSAAPSEPAARGWFASS